jgi:mannosyl-3-phosphoglycerate phosphatase
MKKLVVFTDLDCTLLDCRTYSFAAALPALDAMAERDVPLVVCSSKTRAEIELYRRRLGNRHPFISENGGGIFIPRGYFGFPIGCSPPDIVKDDDYYYVVLGARYADLRRALAGLRAEGFEVVGFGDMTAEEVAEATGLGAEEARLAKKRDFDEPFVFSGGRAETAALLEAIRARGFRHAEGRFFHIMGESDKGMAVEILTEFYKKKYGDVETAALGDSPNDAEMLDKVQYPVAVRKPDGEYDGRLLEIPGILRADGVGPEGWNRAVLSLLSGQLRTARA